MDRAWVWALVFAPIGCGRCADAPPAEAELDADGLPRLAIPKLDGDATITVDGRLDEPAWRRAATTRAFVNVGTGLDDPTSPVQGKARLAWDDRFLYVAFEVVDRDVQGGFPPDAIDPHLWERDTVEIMLDPAGDGDNEDYFEIQVSPQNLVFDSRFDHYNLPRGGPSGPFGHQAWSAGLTSAVRIDGTIDDASDRDGGYTVELEIPWRSFGSAATVPPSPGDRWRVNLYAMQDNGGVAWSPILGRGNFHKASRFGRVTFVLPP